LDTLSLHDALPIYPENRKFVPDDASWAQESIFFRNYTSNPNSPLYVDPTGLFPSAESVAALIKESGGLVFIPHILQYKEASLSILDYLMTHCAIDGIECYYPTFSAEESSFLQDYAKKHNKFISGGSDYHGENRPGTKIGTGIDGNLNISETIINDWINKIIYIN
jgi:hypothetical protein